MVRRRARARANAALGLRRPAPETVSLAPRALGVRLGVELIVNHVIERE